jgi:hypothetical protein
VSSGATVNLYAYNKKVEEDRIRKKERKNRKKERIVGRLVNNYFRRCGTKREWIKYVDKTLTFGSTD